MPKNFFRSPTLFKRSVDSSFFVFLNVVIAAVMGVLFGYYGGRLNEWETNQSPPAFFRRSVIENEFFSDDQLVIEAAKTSSPAVVSIVATKDLVILERRGRDPFSSFCDDPFFRQFFGDRYCQSDSESDPPRTEKTQVSAGSGFLVSANGLVITNKHVVEVKDADFTVLTNNGKKYTAEILARDPFNDLAVLKISGSDFPTLPLGNSDQLQVGQSVIAIGNALGEFSNTVSRGVISGLSRSITASVGTSSERLEQLIQTDAAINPGNSGGPLLNLQGEVVGVNTAIAQGAQNIGFAIPVNQIKKAIKDIQSFNRIVYPFLGVRYLMVNSEVQKANNLPVDFGAWISFQGENPGIVPNSPAAKAGLQEGDIILEINDQKLTVENNLSRIIQTLRVGQTVKLKIQRQTKVETLSAILEERK